MFVLGNVPVESYGIGAFVDVCTLVPTPQAALQQSQRLLQVSIVTVLRLPVSQVIASQSTCTSLRVSSETILLFKSNSEQS